MLRVLEVVCLFAIDLSAQWSNDPPKITLHGHISSEGEISAEYTIALYSLSGRAASEQTQADPTGEFAVSEVSAGDYRLVVTNRAGAVVEQEFVHVGSGSPIDVRVPKQMQPEAPAGTVTVAQLSHKAPRKAQQELKAAYRARSRGDQEGSLTQLRKAVALDPQFAQAHSDLAAQYIVLKHYDLALAQADEAVKLDSASAVAQLNRSICLVRMNRLEEAEAAARLAKRLDPTSLRSEYALGLILAQQKKFTPEAADNLLQAAEEFPAARLAAAQVLVQAGRASEAKEQLRRYLKNCSGKECAAAQALDHD
ncbi:MAG TPA: tetratricopeptide repeat protein [Bryobacteraceae bacterium]